VPKVEAAATTGPGDSYNDVPKIVRKFHEQKFNEHKKRTNVQAAHTVKGPRAELHKYQLQPIDGTTLATLRS
jgi:hypothetical protein